VVGFTGDISFDSNMPDGAPRKLLKVTRISTLGWQPKFTLKEGLKITYRWYLNNVSEIRL